jgi:hypothetical protein
MATASVESRSTRADPASAGADSLALRQGSGFCLEVDLGINTRGLEGRVPKPSSDRAAVPGQRAARFRGLGQHNARDSVLDGLPPDSLVARQDLGQMNRTSNMVTAS